MDPYDREQFIENIELQLLERILTKEPSREQSILEVAFGLALKNLALDEFEKFKNSTAGNIGDLDIDRSLVDGTEEGESIDRPIEFVADVTSGPEEILLQLDLQQHHHRLLDKALKAVSNPRHREAAILHWGHGVAIDSSKRGKDCLTRRFRKDARQIKHWLDTSMRQMRAALAIPKV
jgi:hypothetical protein